MYLLYLARKMCTMIPKNQKYHVQNIIENPSGENFEPR